MPDIYALDEPEAQADALYTQHRGGGGHRRASAQFEQQVAELQRLVATPLHMVMDSQG